MMSYSVERHDPDDLDEWRYLYDERVGMMLSDGVRPVYAERMARRMVGGWLRAERKRRTEEAKE